MGIKKRNKVSAEFSMSSLTDIIFLLLIFFMLTSSIVQINLDLPEATSKAVAPSNMIVSINKKSEFSYNGKPISSMSKLRRIVANELKTTENRKEATLTIAAEKGSPFENVTKVMNVAKELKMRAIIATKPVE